MLVIIIIIIIIIITLSLSVRAGESMPVAKTEGDNVFGSTLNHHGLIYVRATRVGSDTALV
jgi:P-type Cu+ transporter